MSAPHLLFQASAVAIGGRAVMIEGPPGSGKSSLALALIDRGAKLIGDDGVKVFDEAGQIIASPPPNIAGKLEIRGVGIVEMSTAEAPLALILLLDPNATRFPHDISGREIMGTKVPVLPFRSGDAIQGLRAEWALRVHGLATDAD